MNFLQAVQLTKADLSALGDLIREQGLECEMVNLVFEGPALKVKLPADPSACRVFPGDEAYVAIKYNVFASTEKIPGFPMGLLGHGMWGYRLAL